MRGGGAVAFELRRELLEARRSERLAFEAFQDLGEEDQALGVGADAADDLHRARFQPAVDRGFEEDDDEQRPEQRGGDVIDQRGGERCGEHGGDDAPRAGGKQRRLLGPLAQRRRVEADAEVFAEHGEPFTEIEFLAQVDDDFLALEDFRDGRAVAEPFRQEFFAHGQARGGEQFEQAAGAEDVEVFGVDVFWVAEAIAGAAVAGPEVFDAGEAALVESGRGFGAGFRAESEFVEDRESGVDGYGRQDPVRSEHFGMEGEPRYRDSGCHRG